MPGGELDVAGPAGAQARSLLRGQSRLRQPDAVHLGAHQVPIHQVPGQQRDAVVVAERGEPGVVEAPAEVRTHARLQVHEQEGHLALHVDPAQRGVELDAVEGRDAIGEAYEVGEVEIAVPFAHETCREPRIEARRERRCALSGPGLEPPQGVRQLRGRRLLGEGMEVRQRGPRHGRRIAETLARPRRGQLALEVRQRAREILELRRFEPARLEPAVEPGVVGKAAHADRRLGLRLRRAHPPAAGRGARADEIEVELRREPAVEPKLLLAVMPASFPLAEIEEAEIQRLLELAGVLAGQEDPRDVCLDQLDALGRPRPRGRLLQVGDELGGGILGVHPWRPPDTASSDSVPGSSRCCCPRAVRRRCARRARPAG
jgi:hypothetical protein